MMIGALVDAGVPLTPIVEHLKCLGLVGYTLKVWRAQTHGFAGTRFMVDLTREHSQEAHRTWEDIFQIITGSNLPLQIIKSSLMIFEKLAQAEARIHGVPLEKVHFHEVGALDSIVDIVGTAIALHGAGIEKIYCSPIPTGYGYIRTAHGLLPIPAPATAELLKGLPIRSVEVEGELVTPTGAALVATLVEGFGLPPAMRIGQIGYGLGSNVYRFPNFLRVFIGEELFEIL